MSVFEAKPVLVAGEAHRSSSWHRMIPALLAGLDAGLILVAFAAAYWTRYSLKLGPQIQERVSAGQYLPLVALLLVVLMCVLAAKGAYSTSLSRESVDEIATIFSAATISIAVIVVVTTMLHRYEYSRGVILYLWLLIILLVSLGRTLFRAVRSALYRRGHGIRRLLVAGASDTGKMVMQSVMSRPDLGYQLVGFVEEHGGGPVSDFGRFRALGTLADIPGLLETGEVDEIIVALPASAHEEISPILGLCERHGVGLKLVPDLFEVSLGRVHLDDIAGIPLLDVKDRPLRRLERAVKRALDVAVASCLLLVSLPMVAIIAAVVRLESGTPIMLRQERVGLGARHFRCYKFRTMRRDALTLQSVLHEYNEADGPLFKMRNDPRCTPVGRRLRRWSLDEIPQLWNVVKGEMSLVGPRPPLPEEVVRYDERQMRRLDAKPGMTGIWQVSGRSDLGFDEMVLMDLYYVDNWSIGLDIKITIRTVMAVLGRRGAY